MKTIPSTFQELLDRPHTAFCYCAKVVTKTGAVYGFTTLDQDVVFDDGYHAVTYSCDSELMPQNIQHESSFGPDNTELRGWFNTALEKLILAGLFQRAELTIYRVAYNNLAAGVELIAFGRVGEIDFANNSKTRRKIEYISLRGQLEQVVNDMYSLTCRVPFGSPECGLPFVWHNATVTIVGDSPFLNFRIGGVAQPNNYFDFGIIDVLTGDNAGATLEVELWAADGTVQLSFLSPYPFKPGDQLRIRRDCGKTFADCFSYGNVINMRAEHLTPVENSSVMVPGAYVKSVGAS